MQITLRPAPLAAAVVTALLTFSLGAWPGAPQRVQLAPRAVVVAAGAAQRFGKSVGSPNEGKLVGGTHLDETPYLRVVPGYAHGDVRWGLEPLVQLLDRSARAVRRQFPEAVASVGHLSRAGGGEIDRHHSHESGRDADVGFYIRNRASKPVLADRFVAFKADGTASHFAGALFDDVKNWTFVQALLTDPQAHVTHIFVAAPLRARLLAFAERAGAPAAVRVRAAEVLIQPRGALPHDDHFHVRIGCPAHMRECIEYPTTHARLAAHGPRPAHARPRMTAQATRPASGQRSAHATAPAQAGRNVHSVPPTPPPRAAPEETHEPRHADDFEPPSLSIEDPDGL